MRVFSTFPPASSTVFARELTSPGRSGPYAVMIAFSALANGSSVPPSCVAKPRKPRKLAGRFPRTRENASREDHAACRARVDHAGGSHPRDAARRTAKGPRARDEAREIVSVPHLGSAADVEVVRPTGGPETNSCEET